MIVYLIPSDDPRIQYLSFSLWVLLYSCPIPMSYLLNEKRVKEVIIKEGWIEGVKSVFHTSKKIRQQDILSLQNRDIDFKIVRNNDVVNHKTCVNDLQMDLIEDHKTSKINQIKISTNRQDQVSVLSYPLAKNYCLTNILTHLFVIAITKRYLYI